MIISRKSFLLLSSAKKAMRKHFSLLENEEKSFSFFLFCRIQHKMQAYFSLVLSFAETYEIFVGFKKLNFAVSVLLHRNKLQLELNDAGEVKIK
jgi:hypothetical protein